MLRFIYFKIPAELKKKDTKAKRPSVRAGATEYDSESVTRVRRKNDNIKWLLMLKTLRIGPWLACWRTRSLGHVAKGEWMKRDWVRRCWEKLGHSTEGKKKKFPLDALDSRRRFRKPTIAIGLPRILKVNRRLVCYFHRSRVAVSSFPVNLGFCFFDFGIFRFKIRVWIRFWYKTKGGFWFKSFLSLCSFCFFSILVR